MIKYILIDIDGTLMDTKGAFYKSLNKTLAHFGIEETHIDTLFGLSADEALKVLNLSHNPNIKEYWENSFAVECSKTQLYDGIEEMIRTLHREGIRFYIVTSRSRCTVIPLLESTFLHDFILGYVSAEDTVLHKPHPEPIFSALITLNAKADEAIYIGDTVWDCIAAKKAGISFAQAAWNKDASNTSYDIIFHHPFEVITFIGGINK